MIWTMIPIIYIFMAWVTSIIVGISEHYNSTDDNTKPEYMCSAVVLWPIYYVIISSLWVTNKLKEMRDNEEDKDDV